MKKNKARRLGFTNHPLKVLIPNNYGYYTIFTKEYPICLFGVETASHHYAFNKASAGAFHFSVDLFGKEIV